MPCNPRGFAAFFRSLPAPFYPGASSTTKTSFRFFARDQGGFYTSHGPEVQEIARRFFSTQTVVRQQAGLPSLSISHKLFASRVLPALLASGVTVEIWEPVAGGPSGKEEWVVGKRASPGNTRELEELMLSSFSAHGSEAEAEATALLGTSVMMAVQAQGGKHGKPFVLGEWRWERRGGTRRCRPYMLCLARDTQSRSQSGHLYTLTFVRPMNKCRCGSGECIIPHPCSGTVGGHERAQGPGGASRAGRKGGREESLDCEISSSYFPHSYIYVQVGAKECLVLCQGGGGGIGAEGGEKKEDYLRKSILDVMTR